VTNPYDSAFYSRIRDRSRRSADAICTFTGEMLRPASVLDVGCGDGSWLAAWRALGVQDILGVDGSYLDPATLVIDPASFLARNLSAGLELGRRFDLVESLEVAEHLVPDAAERFVASLVRHSDVVLFSAAPPGQIGNGHVNLRPYDYWRRLFAAHGYACYDAIRPAFAASPEVGPWYRFNAFLYIHRDRAAGLPACLAAARVPDVTPLRDSAPWGLRVRRAMLRGVPSVAGTWLSRLSARAASLTRRR
jgi:SAM-dependent methyltransferase